MDTNQKLFVRKWQLELQAKHCHRSAPAGVVCRALRSPRILWLGLQVPEADRDFTSIRTVAILKMLIGAEYDITYLPVHSGSITHKLEAQFYGVDVLPAWDAAEWRRSTFGGCQYDGIVIAQRETFETLGLEVRACFLERCLVKRSGPEGGETRAAAFWLRSARVARKSRDGYFCQ